MKRVLCLIESLGPGGAERQLTGLAVMLKDRGYQVEICYYIEKLFYLPFLRENGVDGFFLEEAKDPKMRFFVLMNHIKVFQPDTVISYSVSPSMIACLLKRLGMRFKLIVSERSSTQIIDRRAKLKFKFYKWADYIVPNSHSQGRFVRENFPLLSSKVKVITNYVDTGKYAPSTVLLPKNDTTMMICVGSLMRPKNIPQFIAAISRVCDDGYRIRVDWYGQDLHDSYSEECHKAVMEFGLEDVFVFHSPSLNIHQKYQSSDVFCLPSLYEGFPNVLCEAMSCGLPVLCSRIYDNPTIVSEGENGMLFNPSSVEDMATSIEKFIDLSSDKKMEMGENNRKRSLAMFSPDRFIQEYQEII